MRMDFLLQSVDFKSEVKAVQKDGIGKKIETWW